MSLYILLRVQREAFQETPFSPPLTSVKFFPIFNDFDGGYITYSARTPSEALTLAKQDFPLFFSSLAVQPLLEHEAHQNAQRAKYGEKWIFRTNAFESKGNCRPAQSGGNHPPH